MTFLNIIFELGHSNILLNNSTTFRNVTDKIKHENLTSVSPLIHPCKESCNFARNTHKTWRVLFGDFYLTESAENSVSERSLQAAARTPLLSCWAESRKICVRLCVNTIKCVFKKPAVTKAIIVLWNCGEATWTTTAQARCNSGDHGVCSAWETNGPLQHRQLAGQSVYSTLSLRVFWVLTAAMV